MDGQTGRHHNYRTAWQKGSNRNSRGNPCRTQPGNKSAQDYESPAISLSEQNTRILKSTTNSAGIDHLCVVAHQRCFGRQGISGVRECGSVLRMQITWHGVSTMNSQSTVSNHCDELGGIWIGPICPIRFAIMRAFLYSICPLTHPCQKLQRSRCSGVG